MNSNSLNLLESYIENISYRLYVGENDDYCHYSTWQQMECMVFSAGFCICKAILCLGQPGLMIWLTTKKDVSCFFW